MSNSSMRLGSSQKNMSTQGINMTKYRSPSPSTINKPPTITIGTMKNNGGNNAKWK